MGEPSVIYMRRVEEDGFTFPEESPEVEIMRADDPSDQNVAEGMSLIFIYDVMMP